MTAKVFLRNGERKDKLKKGRHYGTPSNIKSPGSKIHQFGDIKEVFNINSKESGLDRPSQSVQY